MKVLAAWLASWVLWRIGDLFYWCANKVFVAAINLEDWAGIGEADEYKVGGKD
jgi:hypothetical protein